jgi:hypothetical protein
VVTAKTKSVQESYTKVLMKKDPTPTPDDFESHDASVANEGETTTKHPGGRPTKYTAEIWALIDEYFEEATPLNMRIPTVEGLCLKLDINQDTAYDWAKKFPEFSETLGLIKRKQKEYLTEIGIFGGKEINANIVALFLKANHGMVETSRQEITGKDGESLVIIKDGSPTK